LQPKTERLDDKMLNTMMKRYEKEDENEVMIKDTKQEDYDLMVENEDVSRDIYLPSIKDSKLWRVNITPGRERELVLKITNKLIEFLNHGNPLNVLEVFQCQLSSGVIYCEAYKIQHVEKVLQGLSGVNFKTIRMIPINEMTEVMKSCQTQQKMKFQEHQWVRIKGGIYKDDLGLIEKVDRNKKATVRLIPRIPNDFYTDPNKNVSSLRSYNKKSQYIRIPQLLFNPLRVKHECQKDYIKGLRKNLYVWRGMLFRNGYLYQEFKANKLLTENVCPSLKEVKQFQIDITNQVSMDYDDDDQDEWDILNDQTLLKTIRDDP